jgi:hypothetical protein
VQELRGSLTIMVWEHGHIGPHVIHSHRNPLEHRIDGLTREMSEILVLSPVVTTPPEIIPYYRLNHSIWSLSDNKEVSR